MGGSGQSKAPVPIVQEVGWASEPVWTQRLQEAMHINTAMKEEQTPYDDSNHRFRAVGFFPPPERKVGPYRTGLLCTVKCEAHRTPRDAHVSPAGGVIWHQSVWQSSLSIQVIQFLILYYACIILMSHSAISELQFLQLAATFVLSTTRVIYLRGHWRVLSAFCFSSDTSRTA
jgi:hypothetical protein